MSKPRKVVASGRAWERPALLPGRHPAYRRHEPGSGASVERVKLRPDRASLAVAVEVDGQLARGRTHKRQIRKGQSTEAGRSGGPSRSS